MVEQLNIMTQNGEKPKADHKAYPRQFLVKFQNIACRNKSKNFLHYISRIIEIIIRLIWCAHLPSMAKIHPSTHFGHNALGVIINPLTEIGPNCFIGSHVVIGGKAPLIGAAIIEKNVTIHTGAKLIGKITIGEGSVIGANAVVTKDVPAFCLVAGVPGKIIKTDIDPSKYR
jgi:serine O-acetyltransferase